MVTETRLFPNGTWLECATAGTICRAVQYFYDRAKDIREHHEYLPSQYSELKQSMDYRDKVIKPLGESLSCCPKMILPYLGRSPHPKANRTDDKRMKRLCKTKTVFRLPTDAADTFQTLNLAYEPQGREYLAKHYAGQAVEVINLNYR